MFSESNIKSEQNPDAEKNFRPKKIFETQEARQKEAEKFVESLSRKPKLWKMTGGSARGDFKPDSDIDITALYEKEEDVPIDEILSRKDPDNDLIDGYIDFHYFSED